MEIVLLTRERCIDSAHTGTQGDPGGGDGTTFHQPAKAGHPPRGHRRGDHRRDKGIADDEAFASLVRRRLKGVVGEDPLLTERLWTVGNRSGRGDASGSSRPDRPDRLGHQIKKANLPAYKMLGGNTKIPVYASTVTWDTMDEYERHIKECVDAGFTAFKLHAWGDWKEDAKLSRNLRKWTGPDAALMFDGSAGWDYDRLNSAACSKRPASIGTRSRCASSTSQLQEASGQPRIPVLGAETSDGVHWNAATWIDMARSTWSAPRH